MGADMTKARSGALSDGERWARELLGDLRCAGWRPRAWGSFMARSLERAGETARARPALARQARRWSVAGVAGNAAAVALMRTRGLPVARPRVAVGWALAGGAMLRWHIGMVEGPHGEPRRALSAADAATYARLLAAPAMLASAGDQRCFLTLLGGGAASDAVDGVLARRRFGPTRLGRDLDAAADVAFFAAAALAAGRAGFLTRPAVALLGARELALVGGSAVHYFARAAPPPAEAIGATRFAGPLVTLGLALAAGGRRSHGSAVVIVAAGAAAVCHAVALRRGA